MTLARMEAGHRSAPISVRSRRGVNGVSYGPTSLPSDLRGSPSSRVPETEEEYQEYYQDKIYLSQSQQLYPLKEDLADWINKTLGIDYLTPENFLDMIDNGVIVCQLARVIQERAQQFIAPSDSPQRKPIPKPLPTIGGRLWSNASRGSFFARDNMQNFIHFCNKLGVHPNLLFESDDLVMHNRPRSVILCLLEVSRLASRFNVEPPGLVQLEKEIAEEESHSNSHYLSDSGFSHSSDMSWQFHSPALVSNHEKIRHSRSSSAISGSRWGKTPIGRPRSGDRRSLMLVETNGTDSESHSPVRDLRRTASDGNTGLTASGGTSDGAPSDTMEDDWSRGSSEDQDLEGDQDSGIIHGQNDQGITELDRRVQHATRAAQRQCQCPSTKCNRLKVKKVGEGKYNIAGRNVFIRLLKGRHMMVRVGGGWDTLEHFLLRHDPCQVRIVRRDSPTNKSSSPYLHIQAKYRSPTPSDHVGR